MDDQNETPKEPTTPNESEEITSLADAGKSLVEYIGKTISVASFTEGNGKYGPFYRLHLKARDGQTKGETIIVVRSTIAGSQLEGHIASGVFKPHPQHPTNLRVEDTGKKGKAGQTVPRFA